MSLIKADQSETFLKITARHDLALKLDFKKSSLEEAVWGICSLRSSSLEHKFKCDLRCLASGNSKRIRKKNSHFPSFQNKQWRDQHKRNSRKRRKCWALVSFGKLDVIATCCRPCLNSAQPCYGSGTRLFGMYMHLDCKYD